MIDLEDKVIYERYRTIAEIIEHKKNFASSGEIAIKIMEYIEDWPKK